MKELGDYPPDFEPWFLMWNSVLFYPNPSNPNVKIHGDNGSHRGSRPCHQHKACNSLVLATTKYPPRVCPGCQVDTLKEHNAQPQEERELWLPSR